MTTRHLTLITSPTPPTDIQAAHDARQRDMLADVFGFNGDQRACVESLVEGSR